MADEQPPGWNEAARLETEELHKGARFGVWMVARRWYLRHVLPKILAIACLVPAILIDRHLDEPALTLTATALGVLVGALIWFEA